MMEYNTQKGKIRRVRKEEMEKQSNASAVH